MFLLPIYGVHWNVEFFLNKYVEETGTERYRRKKKHSEKMLMTEFFLLILKTTEFQYVVNWPSDHWEKPVVNTSHLHQSKSKSFFSLSQMLNWAVWNVNDYPRTGNIQNNHRQTDSTIRTCVFVEYYYWHFPSLFRNMFCVFRVLQSQRVQCYFEVSLWIECSFQNEIAIIRHTDSSVYSLCLAAIHSVRSKSIYFYFEFVFWLVLLGKEKR